METKFAYVPGATIGVLLSVFPEFAGKRKCVFATSDSTRPAYNALANVVSDVAHDSREGFLVLRGEDLISRKSTLLVGFDEVYLGKSESWRDLASDSLRESFTTDRCKFLNNAPESVMLLVREGWRYLSDGDGLNLAAEADVVHQALVALSRAT